MANSTKGIKVKVLDASEWKSRIPPQYHIPFAQVFVFRGTTDSLKDKVALSSQSIINSAPSTPLKDIDAINEFLILENIVSISTHQSLAIQSGGNASISLTNPLIQKRRKGGTYFWSRLFNTNEQVTIGSKIRFLSRFKEDEERLLDKDPNTTGAAWFSGEVIDDPETNGNYFNVIKWNKISPISQYISREQLFLEEAAKSSFEPMQKIKIYASSRFQPKIAVTTDINKILRKIEEGKELSSEELFEIDKSAARQHLSPIFTGYIRKVTHSSTPPRQTVDLTATDVLSWLDLSNININPSLDIADVEKLLASEKERAYTQIYTLFAGMRAEEVVREIFLGRKRIKVRENVFLRSKPDTTSGKVGSEIKVGADVTIRSALDKTGREISILSQSSEGFVKGGVNPKIEWYLVLSDEFIFGWLHASEIVPETVNLLDGVGDFVLIEKADKGDLNDRVISKSIPIEDIKNLFIRDKLLLFPALEPTDDAVLRVYKLAFRQNVDPFSSEYATRRQVLEQVTRVTNTELYSDGDGKVWFHPVWAYRDVVDETYVLQPEEVISWAFTETDEELITWVDAIGEVDYDAIQPEKLFLWDRERDDDLIRRFGIRSITITSPNIRSRKGAEMFALAMLKRLNANKLQGQVTMILRPEIKLARNVFIPWLNRIYYIHSIDHTVSWGDRATTTLGLKYGRFPWEPYTPIDYEDAPSATLASDFSLNTASDTTSFQKRAAEERERVGDELTYEDRKLIENYWISTKNSFYKTGSSFAFEKIPGTTTNKTYNKNLKTVAVNTFKYDISQFLDGRTHIIIINPNVIPPIEETFLVNDAMATPSNLFKQVEDGIIDKKTMDNVLERDFDLNLGAALALKYLKDENASQSNLKLYFKFVKYPKKRFSGV